MQLPYKHVFAKFHEFHVANKINIAHMKKWYLLLFYCGMIALNLTAQDDERGMQNDPQAQEILDKVSEKFQSFKTLQSTFKVNIDSREGDVNESYQGKVYLQGDKYRLELETMDIICDNIKRWIHLKDVGELQISFYEPDEENIESPSQLFTIYKDNFYYRLKGDKTTNGKSTKFIELIPMDVEESPYRRIFLYIDPSDYTIVKAEIQSKDDLIYTWQIESMKTNVPIPASKFTFDITQHPGIQVDDMTQ